MEITIETFEYHKQFFLKTPGAGLRILVAAFHLSNKYDKLHYQLELIQNKPKVFP